MNYQPENELLSAYLDGELTPEERARVDQLLADNPAAGQLLDELRTLGVTMRSLPRQTLGEDLSGQVLDVAAKRKTSGNDAARPAAPPNRHPIGRQIADRIKNNLRLVVWPLVIVTVAVVMMVLNPERPGRNAGNGNRDIAQAPRNKDGEKHGDKDAVNSPRSSPNPSQLAPKGNPSGNQSHNPLSMNPRASVFVIQCQVSREVLATQGYRKVFDANHVALPERSASATLDTTPEDVANAAGVDTSVLTNNSAVDGTTSATIFAVEVTPAQMTGIVDGLNANPETYQQFSMHTAQLAEVQPSISAVPPQGANQTPPMKRMLFVFRVVEP